MTAIAGVYRFDGRPGSESTVRTMLVAMQHRGAAHQHVVARGPFALGVSARYNVKGQAFAQGGDCFVAADARLDPSYSNPSGPAPNAEQILSAYRRDHEGFAERIAGDFAIAVADLSGNRVTLLRDRVGVKPLFVAQTSSAFVFASEPKGIIASGEVGSEPNEARIAAYLGTMVAGPDATFFRSIRRFLPGHLGVVDPRGVSTWRYWSFALDNPPNERASPEDFHSILSEAVTTRMAGPMRTGAMLSGGLDSPSVALVAQSMADAPLPTFSMVFPLTPEADERRFIERVLARGRFQPHFVDGGSRSPIAGLGRMVSVQDGPFDAPGLISSSILYAAAAEAGVGRLLDGHGGDETISYGMGRLQELAIEGRWLELWSELRLLGTAPDVGVVRVFASYVLRHGLRSDHPLLSRPLRLARHFGARALGGGGAGGGPLDHIEPHFAERQHLRELLRAQGDEASRAALSERTLHRANVLNPSMPEAFEILDRTAIAADVEPVYPLWDTKLVQYCLDLPSEQKLSGGWTRLILRRAMEGLMPPEVQWRKDKTNFLSHFAKGFLGPGRGLVEDVLADRGGDLAPYLRLPVLREAFARALVKPAPHDLMLLFRVTALAVWLRRDLSDA